MITNFNEQLWIDFDLEVAVFLENITAWIRYNSVKPDPTYRNYRNGRYWTYDTYKEISKRFIGWSPKSIRTIIARCVKNDLLIIDNFNKKKYDNTNWYTLTDKALEYFPVLKELTEKASAQSGNASAQSGKPIPKDLNSISKDIIISDLPNGKSGNDSNQADGNLGDLEGLNGADYYTKSDYHKNQIKKSTLLSENSQNEGRSNPRKPRQPSTLEIQSIIDAYHEILPDCPKIKVVDKKFVNQLTHMQKNWPRYQKEGQGFSIDSFKNYLSILKDHYAWFVKPYKTESGRIRHNNLRVFTREVNITKIVNGEFSAN